MRFYPILFVFLFWSGFIYAQYTVKGKVFSDKDQPIENASVYVNNSTIGTITDNKGNFQLKVLEGEFTLVVSHLGFVTVQTTINTNGNSKLYKFILHEETNDLSEVNLKKVIYDRKWKHNVEVFTRTLLGSTEMSEKCKILNPEVLRFEKNDSVLIANTVKPLEIEHKGLGYIITYDLVLFERYKDKMFYLGRIKYKELSGGKSKQKKWKKNREKAYHGSRMHFVRSLRKENLEENGFIVDQFQKIPNPNRPSEKAIDSAWKVFRKNYKESYNLLYKDIDQPKTELDSLIVLLKKRKLPKFTYKYLKYNLKEKDILHKVDNIYYLQFDYYLSINYTREKNEKGYTSRFGIGSSLRKGQTSSIKLYTDKVILDSSGEIIKPLDYFSEGYWSYEQLADMLPLNYQTETMEFKIYDLN